MTASADLMSAFERRARLGALRPEADTSDAAWFAAWLDAVPGPAEDRDDAVFRVVLDPAVDVVCCSAQAAAEPYLEAFAGLLGSAGAPVEAWTAIRAVVADLEPTRFGTWIALTQDEPSELGWWIPGVRTVDELRPLLPSCGGATEQLLDWAVGREAADLGAAIGGEAPPVQLAVTLRGASRADMLRDAAGAFAAAGVRPLPTELDAIFGTDPVSQPGRLTISLLEDELERIAVELPEPSETARIAAADVFGVEQLMPVIRAEGVIGEPPCERMGFVVDADGLSVRFHYTLA